MGAESRLNGPLLLGALAVLSSLACGGGGGGGGGSPTQPGPGTTLERITADLTETIESPNFIFHFEPGDTVEVERSEAYHEWATAYLGVVTPKKIDFYKFPTQEEQTAAFGERFGGQAFPDEFAVSTFYSWHNHECMHLYTWLIGNPPQFFSEGMSVAHEYDPYNDVWISQWNRAEPYREPHIDIVRDLKARGVLYSIESILASSDFNARVLGETERIAYPQAGMFVAFLIDVHGLARMKQALRTISYFASTSQISDQFEAIYGIDVATAESAWLDWLDQPH